MDFIDFMKFVLTHCPQLPSYDYKPITEFMERIEKDGLQEDGKVTDTWDEIKAEVLDESGVLESIKIEEPAVIKPEPRYKLEPKLKIKPLPKLIEDVEEETEETAKESTKAKILPMTNKPIRASSYSAVEIHGFFGLIDDGSASGGRMLIAHVPKYVRGYFLDIKDGDVIHICHVNGKRGGRLRVLAVGRHKYYAPGRRVTTCTICVPEEQWADFL